MNSTVEGGISNKTTMKEAVEACGGGNDNRETSHQLMISVKRGKMMSLSDVLGRLSEWMGGPLKEVAVWN